MTVSISNASTQIVNTLTIPLYRMLSSVLSSLHRIVYPVKIRRMLAFRMRQRCATHKSPLYTNSINALVFRLGVDETIAEAEYGIKRMRENTAPFDFYLKGPLACLKGVLDYLLEEYNSKYQVGIKDDEDLNQKNFEEKVKAGKNSRAEAFINSYKEKKKILLTDPKCKILLERHDTRDIAIHRKQPTKNINLSLNVGMSASPTSIVVRDKNGNITARRDSPPQAMQVPPPKVQYFLSDWMSDDIPSLCEYTLSKLKKLVEALRTEYV